MKNEVNVGDLTPQQRLDLARGTEAAPVGEREAFEVWWRAAGLNDGFISYWSREAFQAGTAYQRAQQPQSEYGDAYQGAREDLAIWKRRALEAESRVREQDQIIENLGNALNAENGPTFMGEPVIQQPQSAEAVPEYALRSRIADLLHLLQFAKIETSTPTDAAQAEIAMNDLEAMLASTPQPSAGVVMPEPYGWVAAGNFYTDREAAITAAGKTPCIEVYNRQQMAASERRSAERQGAAEELARLLNAEGKETRELLARLNGKEVGRE